MRDTSKAGYDTGRHVRFTWSGAVRPLRSARPMLCRQFRPSPSAALSGKFLPIVKKATQKVKLAEKYNEFAGKGAKFGLVDQKDADLNNYVTRKALDGLFLMIAEEERKIRKDPVGSASSIISKVFGAIGK